MVLPSALLGFLLSALYGTAFHFWRGGGAGRLVLYILLSMVGFWMGHWIGNQQGWAFLQVGSLQLGSGTLGSFCFLLIGHWLSQIQRKGSA